MQRYSIATDIYNPDTDSWDTLVIEHGTYAEFRSSEVSASDTGLAVGETVLVQLRDPEIPGKVLETLELEVTP